MEQESGNREPPSGCPAHGGMMAYRPNALFSDGAAHARLRLAVTDSLGCLDELRLTQLTARCAAYLIARFDTERSGRAELMADYARPLPLLVFSELFGCPPGVGDRVVTGVGGIFAGAAGADRVLTEALDELIALKRGQPGADLTTRLMHHPVNLSDEEVLHQPPIADYAPHHPTVDVELNGRILKANDPVLISFAAANTDPRPAEHREWIGSKAHLAFGAGPHACPAKDPAFTITTGPGLLSRFLAWTRRGDPSS